jgi:hypothetical protein
MRLVPSKIIVIQNLVLYTQVKIFLNQEVKQDLNQVVMLMQLQHLMRMGKHHNVVHRKLIMGLNNLPCSNKHQVVLEEQG